MKKISALLTLIFLTVITLTGCNNSFYADYDLPDVEIAENITAATEFPEYERDVEHIKVNVTNNTDEEIGTGTFFFLQKMEEGEWRVVSVSGNFKAIAQCFLPSTTSQYIAELKDHVKLPLPSGLYRIGIEWARKEDGKILMSYAEFTVK